MMLQHGAGRPVFVAGCDSEVIVNSDNKDYTHLD